MKKAFVLVVLALSLFWLMPSFAVLDLQLTNGNKRAIPLGVSVLAGDAAGVTKTQFMDVVKTDLTNSGWFHLLDRADSNAVGFRGEGADAFLTGTMNQRVDGQLQLSLSLIGLYSGSASGEQLLRLNYQTNVSGLRRLAHRVSDQIFLKLTGVRGNFSTKIAYVAVEYPPKKYVNFNLMVADADGHNPRLLLKSYQPIMSLAWAPNGRELAYVSFLDHHAEIYLQSLTTGQRQRVIAAPGINGAPAFSPDGRYMALVLSKTGNPKIYQLDLATKELHQLTHGSSIDTEPSWSPDGKSLLFTSNRDGNPQVYQYNMDSDKVTRLTFDGNYNARPRWLPSGQGFIMMHRGSGGHGFSVAVQHLGSHSVQILTRPGTVESPSLAPNGQMVVYAVGSGLGQVSIDSDVALSMPSREGVIQEPVWSPFLG